MSNGYGISKWEDAKTIYNELHELTSKPIYCVSEEALKDVLDYFETKCAKSKAITTEAKQYIPGGVQHNLAFNYPFPICVTKAEGAFLYDLDGNKYYDFLQAGGPTILGSNYAPVREKVIELLNDCGPVTGLFHEGELLLAKEINKHMPNVEMFRMLGSGTESVMAAIRVARCATKAKRIIKVGGAYHGWSDQMVYGLKIPGSRFFLESHGIPHSCYGTTDEVRPNDLDMLEKMLKLNKMRGGTAAVIVEPVGPESGTRPVDFNYNKEVRKLCDKYGCLFIFDEVVTGFRVGLGGAQGYFDVVPDLTIFGKIVAGGYPSAGGVGGKKEFVSGMAVLVEALASIMLQIAESLPEQLPVFIEQMLTLIQDLATTIAENAPILIDVGIKLMLALAEGIVKSLPTIIEMLPTIITTIANVINDNMPTILMAGVQILMMLIEGIIQSIPVLIENIPKIIEAIVAVWSAFNWLELGSKAITLLKNGIVGMISALKGAGTMIFEAVEGAIKSLPQPLKNIAANGIKSMISGFMGMLSTLLNTVGTLLIYMVQAFGSVSLKDIGKNVIQGFIDGILGMGGILLKSVGDLMGNVISKVKGVFGIHSPSREFKYIGKMCVAGMDDGMEGFGDSIVNTAQASLGTLKANVTGRSMMGYGNSQTFNFYDTQTSPDAIRRTFENTMTFGLAGGI